MQTIRYLSNNEHKIAEVIDIIGKKGITVIGIREKIEELQTADLQKLIHDKTVKAFQKIGKPLFIEHTGLSINALGDMPGGLTQLFWDQLGADKFSQWFGQPPYNQAIAKTLIGYNDGRKIHTFAGEISGTITASPRGNRSFQWDCVFVPEGHHQTFAEMGEAKHSISMRRQALEKFADFLQKPENKPADDAKTTDVSDLARQIAKKKVVLFVGAGVSMNFGLPSFRQLMNNLATQLDFDPALFHLLGDYLSLAEYYSLEKNGLGDLSDCLQHHPSNSIKPEGSDLYRALLDLDFPIIYTTNYDNFLEQSYDHHQKPYCKINCITDFANTEPNKTQIIKYHGDFEKDQHLVLTETSYFKRMNFNSPLDIRLRSDIIGKTVLFIGYSLSDINIRYLLYQLHQLWESDGALEAKPKSYIFLAQPNIIQETILKARNIIPIVATQDDPQAALLKFLQDLKIAP